MSPERRELWTNDTIDHMARELRWVEAKQRGEEPHDAAHKWTTTLEEQKAAVEARMALATPLTVVVAAMGNLAHPRHLNRLKRMASDHGSRAVRRRGSVAPALCVGHAMAPLPPGGPHRSQLLSWLVMLTRTFRCGATP